MPFPITDIVVRESGRYLDSEIYRRNFGRSPWFGLIQRGEFPAGLGEQISLLTYERTVPTVTEPTWSDVTTVDGADGGACLPAVTKVGIGSTTRNFNLKRRALEGPDFCAEDLRSPFALRQQLDAIVAILAEYVFVEWEIRDRHEYLRLVKWKATVSTTMQVSEATSAPYFTGCPTSILTQGFLNKWKVRLLRDGASQSALGRENGAAVLTLVCSQETSDDLIFRNADIRQDIRWGKPNELLSPYGVERSYRGFYHLIDSFPIRGNCVGSTFTEVAPFYTVAASKGQKAEVNPTWMAVNSEVSFIFDPMVFKQLIPRPITNPAEKFDFNPVSYTGNWSVKNIENRETNPDKNILYHRGILAAGSMPIHPERGLAALHLRCDASAALVSSCS
jgi:hypothetical protein